MTTVASLFVCFQQDSLQALVADCSFPAIRRNKNVENFLARCEYPKLQLIRTSIKHGSRVMAAVSTLLQLPEGVEEISCSRPTEFGVCIVLKSWLYPVVQWLVHFLLTPGNLRCSPFKYLYGSCTVAFLWWLHMQHLTASNCCISLAVVVCQHVLARRLHHLLLFGDLHTQARKVEMKIVHILWEGSIGTHSSFSFSLSSVALMEQVSFCVELCYQLIFLSIKHQALVTVTLFHGPGRWWRWCNYDGVGLMGGAVWGF